jgi:hypothetical protein
MKTIQIDSIYKFNPDTTHELTSHVLGQNVTNYIHHQYLTVGMHSSNLCREGLYRVFGYEISVKNSLKKYLVQTNVNTYSIAYAPNKTMLRKALRLRLNTKYKIIACPKELL